MSVSIQQLHELIAPSRNHSVGMVEAVIDDVGIALPHDYVEIALAYGFGEFHGGGARLHYFDPTSAGYTAYVLDELEGWERQCQALDIDDLSFYPSDNGILPMGRFDNGLRLAFVCGGSPNEWTLMLFDYLDEESRCFFAVNSLEFLIKTLAGELRPLLGCEENDDTSVRFVEYPLDGWRYTLS